MEQESRYREANVDGVLDDRYKLRREIARGGHGAVFEAEHLVTRGRVAIKTLLRPALDLPAARARLIRETQILAALRHPNVIALHDAGICQTHGPYAVLELVEGRPLDGILVTRQSLSVGQTVAIVIQLCNALTAVHRHGIVHRDVKSSNLLIAAGASCDQVALIDFGIAKLGSVEEMESDKLTKAGELLGTVEYMAPEQIMGSGPVDARSDVYSVGVIIYECLTGEVPYGGAVTSVIANMLAGTQPPAIRSRRRDVPPALEVVVKRARELEPGKRFVTTAELADACLAAYGNEVPVLDLLDIRRDQEPTTLDTPLRADPGAMPLSPLANHRRQYVRAPYVAPVRVLMTQGTTDGRTEDLSEGGVLIITETACVDGERVRLRLPLPMTGRVVEVQAIARWTKTKRQQRAVGAEFVDIAEDVRAEVRAYVALMTTAATAPLRS